MPIYEYRCVDCGHELEALQKMSDAPLSLCPSCDKESLQKLISAAGFRLKGGGWYETDFKQSKTSKDAKPSPAKPDAGGGAPAKGTGGCAAMPDA